MLGDEQDFDGWRWKMKESKQKKVYLSFFQVQRQSMEEKGCHVDQRVLRWLAPSSLRTSYHQFSRLIKLDTSLSFSL